MQKPPKYKSKDIPNLKAWGKIKKSIQKAEKIAKGVGTFLGVTSIISNGIDAYNHFRNGDIKEGFKSVAKATVDFLLIGLKATPVGILVNIGWAVISSWW